MNKTTVLAVAAIIIAAALVTSSLVATDALANKKKSSSISSETKQKCRTSICQSNTQTATIGQSSDDGGDNSASVDQDASNQANGAHIEG
jgi:hypothetical protein